MNAETIQIRKAILTMFACYNLAGKDSDKEAKFMAYEAVLSELPAEMVIAACNAAIRGQIGNPGFLPTVAELYQAAVPKPPAYHKPPPKWLPNQSRFKSSSGTLFIDGRVYSASEVASYERGVWPPASEPATATLLKLVDAKPTEFGARAQKLVSDAAEGSNSFGLREDREAAE